jgi:hypothetical protein
MILLSGVNLIKIINVFVVVTLFLLVYKGIFVLNEEVLVAICFVLFVSLAVVLLTDVIKASIFDRILQIKNKFYDLEPIIDKEDKSYFNSIYNLGDVNKYDNSYTDYNQIINSFKNEFKSSIQNILQKTNTSLYDITNKFYNLLNNVYIYDIFLSLRIEVVLYLYFVVLYVYFIPVLFVLYIYNIILKKNNNVYLTLLNFIKYKEYKYSTKIYKLIVRELLKHYNNHYKLSKKNLKKIAK